MTTATHSRLAAETSRLLASPLDHLNFGCGPFPLAGWTNIDNGDGEWYTAPEAQQVIKLDLFEALDALPDAVASHIYSEHLFEHFTLAQGHTILRAWRRILKPGGVVRIVCPDLAAEARLMLRQLNPAPDETIDRHRLRWLADRYTFQPGEKLTRAMVLNYGMWLDGHKFVYDEETLTQSLTLAGFERTTRAAFGVSTHPALHNLDSHDGGETGRSFIPSLALVMEATRPGRDTRAPAPSRVPPPAPAAPEPKPGPAPVTAPDALKQRIIEITADLCAARGYAQVALYPGGKHSARILHNPWTNPDVRIAAVLDDAPSGAVMEGIPVMKPADVPATIDAVIVSSDTLEDQLGAKADALFGPRGIPVIRLYTTK